jgi:hypothetical protein
MVVVGPDGAPGAPVGLGGGALARGNPTLAAETISFSLRATCGEKKRPSTLNLFLKKRMPDLPLK